MIHSDDNFHHHIFMIILGSRVIMMNYANLQQAPYDGKEKGEIPGGSIDGSTGQAREEGWSGPFQFTKIK